MVPPCFSLMNKTQINTIEVVAARNRYYVEPSETHSVDPFSLSPLAGMSEKECMHHMVNKTKGIITLYRHQRAAFVITSKRGPTPKTSKTATTELPPGSTITTDTDEVGDRESKHLPVY